jgi:hypothetical protein
VARLEARPGALLHGGGDDRHQPGQGAVHPARLRLEHGLGARAEPHPHPGPSHGGVEALDSLGVERETGVGEEQGAQPFPHVDRPHQVGGGHLLAGVHEVARRQPLAQGIGARELVLAVLEVDAVHEPLHEAKRRGSRLLGSGLSGRHN